ncbi:hypothetical protein DFJ66_5715 [Saccharothrix variisporea]|uniref:Uncharacterized protein n=1 Tax=Saccharothrix variisporea TaxID=543527 RepID=A0A495XI19_9PSEU|nr:hypothetical protein DFJ66_5715 [Saccharothrix variisporea]
MAIGWVCGGFCGGKGWVGGVPGWPAAAWADRIMVDSGSTMRGSAALTMALGICWVADESIGLVMLSGVTTWMPRARARASAASARARGSIRISPAFPLGRLAGAGGADR